MTLTQKDFEGRWRVDRVIADRHAGQEGRFDGRASFVPLAPDGLLYQEEGRLRLGDGPAFEARRSYLWRFRPDRVEVSFDDGRPFHSFRPAGQGAGTDHPCGEDSYRVTYDFQGWPFWTATWTVTGPRKDYTMVTRYSERESLQN